MNIASTCCSTCLMSMTRMHVEERLEIGKTNKKIDYYSHCYYCCCLVYYHHHSFLVVGMVTEPMMLMLMMIDFSCLEPRTKSVSLHLLLLHRPHHDYCETGAHEDLTSAYHWIDADVIVSVSVMQTMMMMTSFWMYEIDHHHSCQC